MITTNVPEFSISLKMKTKQSELIKVNSVIECVDLCRQVFDADSIDWVESFIVIALNRNNKVMGFYKVSQGGISGTVADPRVIMQFALLSNASSLILCHNHPSGNTQPSKADDTMTFNIKEAGNYLSVKILDHIILTSESFYSYADEGRL